MKTNKPEVKRYTPAYSVDSVMRSHLLMEECERGAWVSLEDHEALQAECEKLRKRARTAEREHSKALRTLKGLERVAQVVSDNSDAVCGENNKLRVECEKLRKDAGRYRWLRDNCEMTADEYGTAGQLYFGTYQSGRLDEAIDAAIQEDNPC